MTLEGTVVNGVIVLVDHGPPLPEGSRVQAKLLDAEDDDRDDALKVSPVSATRWRRRIEAVASDADQGSEADEAVDLSLDLRCRSVGRRPHVYRVLFTTNEDTVFTHRVVRAARDRLTTDDI